MFFCDGGSTCLFRASFATSASTSFLKQTIHPKSGWKTRKKLFFPRGLIEIFPLHIWLVQSLAIHSLLCFKLPQMFQQEGLFKEMEESLRLSVNIICCRWWPIYCSCYFTQCMLLAIALFCKAF